VISDDISKKNKINTMLLFNITWIIIHLGINPEKGGRPPNERRLMGIESINKDLEILKFSRSDML